MCSLGRYNNFGLSKYAELSHIVSQCISNRAFDNRVLCAGNVLRLYS